MMQRWLPRSGPLVRKRAGFRSLFAHTCCNLCAPRSIPYYEPRVQALRVIFREESFDWPELDSRGETYVVLWRWKFGVNGCCCASKQLLTCYITTDRTRYFYLLKFSTSLFQMCDFQIHSILTSLSITSVEYNVLEWSRVLLKTHTV